MTSSGGSQVWSFLLLTEYQWHKDGVHTFIELIPLKLTKKTGKWVDIFGEQESIKPPAGMDKFSGHAVAANKAERETDESWQSGTNQCVRLTIRHKTGALGPFQATFHVIAPDKTEYTKTITISNNEMHSGDVLFPADDFGSLAAPPGVYKWFAIVNGKQVVSGQFEFSHE